MYTIIGTQISTAAQTFNDYGHIVIITIIIYLLQCKLFSPHTLHVLFLPLCQHVPRNKSILHQCSHQLQIEALRLLRPQETSLVRLLMQN